MKLGSVMLLWILVTCSACVLFHDNEPRLPDGGGDDPSEDPMPFILIAPGSFVMGSAPTEPGRDSVEIPHEVELTHPFYLQQTEVTQYQWRQMFENAPYTFTSCNAECPVETVSWFDAVAYCNALSQEVGVEECYSLNGCTGTPGDGFICTEVLFVGLDCLGYRLPTESEWEYAARAGTLGPYSNNGAVPPEETGCEVPSHLDDIAWYCGNAEETPHPVATRTANPWGLYDMTGNVWEWVWDWYNHYPLEPVVDPLGEPAGETRVMRGGSFNSWPAACRSASRAHQPPAGWYDSVGFRVARTAP